MTNAKKEFTAREIRQAALNAYDNSQDLWGAMLEAFAARLAEDEAIKPVGYVRLVDLAQLQTKPELFVDLAAEKYRAYDTPLYTRSKP